MGEGCSGELSVMFSQGTARPHPHPLPHPPRLGPRCSMDGFYITLIALKGGKCTVVDLVCDPMSVSWVLHVEEPGGHWLCRESAVAMCGVLCLLRVACLASLHISLRARRPLGIVLIEKLCCCRRCRSSQSACSSGSMKRAQGTSTMRSF